MKNTSIKTSFLAAALLAVASAAAISSGFQSTERWGDVEDAPRPVISPEISIDHGDGILSNAVFCLSKPLTDEKGQVVRVASYRVDLLDAAEYSQRATLFGAPVLRADGSEAVEGSVMGVYPEGTAPSGEVSMYKFSARPKTGLTWRDVETPQDYTLLVVRER